jgi:hypothetical protein
MNALWMRQIAAVWRLEWKKTLLSKRGWWIYCLALGPVFLTALHWLVESRVTRHSHHSLGEDSVVFAAMFQFFYLRGAIFFGCMGLFSITTTSRRCAARCWWPESTWPAWPWRCCFSWAARWCRSYSSAAMPERRTPITSCTVPA